MISLIRVKKLFSHIDLASPQLFFFFFSDEFCERARKVDGKIVRFQRHCVAWYVFDRLVYRLTCESLFVFVCDILAMCCFKLLVHIRPDDVGLISTMRLVSLSFKLLIGRRARPFVNNSLLVALSVAGKATITSKHGDTTSPAHSLIKPYKDKQCSIKKSQSLT